MIPIGEYLEWALKTFPDETLVQQATHLLKETKELEESGDIEEMVDVYMIACLIKHRVEFLSKTTFHMGCEFEKAFVEKLAKNKKRRWARSADGDYQHIP